MRSVLLTTLFTLLLTFIASPARADKTFITKDGHIQLHTADSYFQSDAPPPHQIKVVDSIAGTTVLVMAESQSKYASLAECGETFRDALRNALKDSQTDAGTKLEIGEYPAIRYEIAGIRGGVRIAYLVTVIQTETKFVEVCESCGRDKFDDQKDHFERIAETIKELPPDMSHESKK